jgi:hypothetical protein
VSDLSGVWRYDTSQVIGAPAAGYLRTTAAPVTRMAVSATTKGGADAHADLVGLTTGAALLLQEVSDATAAGKWQLTAAPVDHTSWVEYAIVGIAYSAVQPPRPNQDLLLTGYASATIGGAAYATVSELQRVLQKPSPTAAETTAMNRVLYAAAQEINWDLGYSPDNPAPSATDPILVDVNLDRAVELWRFNYSAVGVLAVGAEQAPIITPRDTWYRHHLRLSPLRTLFSVA